jgi:hypothetical protein
MTTRGILDRWAFCSLGMSTGVRPAARDCCCGGGDGGARAGPGGSGPPAWFRRRWPT